MSKEGKATMETHVVVECGSVGRACDEEGRKRERDEGKRGQGKGTLTGSGAVQKRRST